MMGWYGGWGGGWLGTGLMMLFWVAVLGVVVWAVVRVAGGGGSPARTAAAPSPRAILDSRLATGEIDAEEYAQLRRLLDGRSAATGPAEPQSRP